MIYKNFKGLNLSTLGFGTMRLPTIDGKNENIDQENTDMYPITFPAVLIDLQEASW